MNAWIEETYAALLEAATPPPKPKPKPATQKLEERNAKRREEAVIVDATNANNVLTETMESRRQKRIAYELAQHAENPEWHRLASWWQSVIDAREAVRSHYGEIPETGNYSPIARFEREMRDK